MPLHRKAVGITIAKCYEILRAARASSVDEMECLFYHDVLKPEVEKRNGF